MRKETQHARISTPFRTEIAGICSKIWKASFFK